MLRLAGAVGDGLIVNLFPLTALPQILGAWRAGAAEAGRDVSGQEVVCRFQVCVTDDVARARQLVRSGLRRLRGDAGLQPLLRLVRLRGRGEGASARPSPGAIARPSPPR